jgi:hypothetical protein
MFAQRGEFSGVHCLFLEAGELNAGIELQTAFTVGLEVSGIYAEQRLLSSASNHIRRHPACPVVLHPFDGAEHFVVVLDWCPDRYVSLHQPSRVPTTLRRDPGDTASCHFLTRRVSQNHRIGGRLLSR